MYNKFLILIISLCIYSSGFGQSGTLNLTFQPSGFTLDTVTSVKVLSSGKILVAMKKQMVRLNSDGSIDNTFNTVTFHVPSPNYYPVRNILVQNDNKIILVGSFIKINGITYNRIVRLNQDGTIDNSYIVGTGADADVLNSCLLSNGQIMICGSFLKYNGISKSRVAKLNTDGTLDNTFTAAIPYNVSANVVNAIEQPDGKIVISMWYNMFRFNSNGTSDPTFAPYPNDGNAPHAIGLQSDGKIIAGGHIAQYAQSSMRRMNEDGTVDTTFPTFVFSFDLYKILVLPTDEILVAGYIGYSNRSGIFRFGRDGALHSVFNTNTGVNATGYVLSMDLQSDYKIIVGGIFTSYDGQSKPYLLRLNNDIVNNCPMASAGNDLTYCKDGVPVSLTGAVTHATGGLWTSSGSGTFVNSSSPVTSYVPSAADYTNGSVVLTLTTVGNGTCAAATDNIVITFTPTPTIQLGPDILVCRYYMPMVATSSVSNVTNCRWTKAGSPVSYSRNPSLLTYYPTAADYANGSVTFVLSTNGNANCNVVSDSVTYTIYSPTLNPNPDLTVYNDQVSVPLSASGIDISEIGWATGGSGTFSSATGGNTIYYPSLTDLNSTSVNIHVTGFGLTRDSTGCGASDLLIINFIPPVVDAGIDIEVADNATSIQLNGNLQSATNNVFWTTQGGGTFYPDNITSNPQYIPSPSDISAGFVTLILSSGNTANAITDTILIVFKKTTSLNSFYNSGEKVGIFPNPVSDFVNFKTNSSGSVLLNIINSAGKIVLESRLESDGKNITIPVKDLSPGIYNIIVYQGDERYIKKFYKQ